jgi:hypothetical protein
MRRIGLAGIVLISVTSVGCGSEPASPDAAVDAGADAAPWVAAPVIPWLADGVPPVTPPDIPWLAAGVPIALGCPPGWEQALDGAPRCEPWPASTAACPAGQLRLPGTTTCHAPGAVCPTGSDWPADLPATGVRYVRAGATGGDGTAASPFGTLAAALAIAGAGETIALAVGDYPEAVVLDRPLSLRGACGGARLMPPASAAIGVEVTAPGVLIADLTIASAPTDALVVTSGDATLRGVAITGSARTGLSVRAGTTAVCDDVLVEGGGAGAAAAVEVAGAMTGRHSTIARTSVTAVHVETDARLTLQDSVVTSVAGDGVVADTRTEVRLERVVLSHFWRGLVVSGTLARADLVDAWIGDGDAGPARGVGALAQSYGTISAQRAWWERNLDTSARAESHGTLDLSDVVVDATTFAPGSTEGGYGLMSLQGSLVLARVAVTRSAYGAIGVMDGSVGTLSDVFVAAVTSTSSGFGVQVLSSATLTVARLVVRDLTGLAVIARVQGRATLSDVSIVGCTGGLDAEQDGDLTADRVDVQNATFGVEALLGAHAHVTNLHIDGAVQAIKVDRGRLEAENVDLAGFNVGVFAMGDGTTVTLADVRLADGTAATSRGNARGAGLTAFEGAQLHVTRALVDRPYGNCVDCMNFMGSVVPSALCELTDFVCRDPVSPAEATDDHSAAGLWAITKAEARITRARFEGSTALALWVESHATIQDLAIVGVVPRSDGLFGQGVHVAQGGVLDGSSLSIEGATSAGMLATDADSTILLSHVRVSDTGPDTCVESCPSDVCAHGLSARDGAHLTLDDFVVERSLGAGVQVAAAGAMDLTNGTVSASGVGRNVQEPSFDVTRVTTTVTYSGNLVTQDTDARCVPDAVVF